MTPAAGEPDAREIVAQLQEVALARDEDDRPDGVADRKARRARNQVG